MSIINPYRYAAADFTCDAVSFDGSNDYLIKSSDWTSNANSKVGIMSVFIQFQGGDGAFVNMASITDGDLGMAKGASGNKLYMKVGSTISAANGSTDIADDDTWHHIIFAWDAAADTRHGYVDGSSDFSLSGSDVDFDWTQAAHTIGASANGSSKIFADVAEFYINNEEYLDISDAANLQKFRDTDGKPVDLGADGSEPTGSSPRVYLHLDDGETVANFAVNAGTGGDYSITGALATASTSPTD